VDPKDANRVMVVFSNYNVFSLFFTEDGGNYWIRASGNLEEVPNSGSGNGPSCRWASILPVGNKTAYFVGTSTGLYATDTILPGDSTIWVQQGTSTIGSTVVDMIKTRESDGLVVVATHGNGIFSTHVTDISQIEGLNEYYSRKDQLTVEAYPNPFHTLITIRYNVPADERIRIRIYDINGKLVRILSDEKHKRNVYSIHWDGKDTRGKMVTDGIYFCNISSAKRSLSKRIVYYR
jgi:hypothetical protein